MKSLLWLLALAACAALAVPVGAQDRRDREDDRQDRDDDRKDNDRRDRDDDYKRAQIVITAPDDGDVLKKDEINVHIWYVSRQDCDDDDDDRVTFIELLVNGKAASTFDVPKKSNQGKHIFKNVDLSKASAGGKKVTLVARAYLGKKRKKHIDSDPVKVTVKKKGDQVAPLIGILTPQNGSILQTLRPPVTAQVIDAGGSGVDPASIIVLLDGAAVARTLAVVNANTVNVAFTPSADLAQGSHTVTVDAKDLSGNAAAQARSTFSIDSAAPGVAISVPLAGSATKNPLQPLNAIVTDVGSAGVDPAGITVRLDGNIITAALTVLSAGQVKVAFTPTSPMGEGVHTYKVDARDRASNASAGVSSSFTVDLTPPVISAPAPPSGSTASSSTPTISAVWTDALSGIKAASAKILLNASDLTGSATLGTAGFSLTAPPLAAGLHTVAVSVEDLAGNIGTLTWSFQGQDAVPPTLTLTPADGAHLAVSKPILTAVYSDIGLGVDLLTFKATLDGADLPGGFTVGATQATFAVLSALSDGPHIFRAEIKDKAGNLTQASSVFRVSSALQGIGPAGGVVQITDPPNPAAGTKLEVPPGALAQTYSFAIDNVVAPPPLPAGYVSVGPIIDITPDVVFSQPATLTVPYSGPAVAAQNVLPQAVRLLKFDAAQGVWILVPLLSNDTAAFKVSALVNQIIGQMFAAAVQSADATETTVGVSGDAAVADGTSFTTLTITPRGPDGTALGPNQNVQVTVTGATSTLLVQDLGNGVYQVFIWSNQAGSATVAISVNGLALPNQVITFTPMPASFGVDGFTNPLAAGTSSPLRLRALRADGTVLSSFKGAVEVNLTGARDASGVLVFPESFVAVFGSGDAGVIQLTNAVTFAKAGSQQISAKYLTQPTVTGTASLVVTAGPPALMTKLAGDNQSGATGTLLPEPLSVKVTDLYGNPVQGVQVRFHVQSGGARLTQ